ncbi:hypothetical protein P1N98_11490, partial [Tsukamurella tyrosinosolvens]|uniref:hypothetical protein n=1 Tax=Tsukamurella tyrosinosolvens TaxID=57704 RepID=UPI002480EE32
GCVALGIPVTGGNVSFYNQTAFHLAGNSPVSSLGEVAVSAGTSGIKAMGDGWSAWSESAPA